MADVVVVASEGLDHPRDRRPVGRGQSAGLDPRLLIDADGVDGIGPLLIDGPLGVDRDVPIDHQDLVHLAIEVWITAFEDPPDGALARVGQTGIARGLGVLGHEPGEGGDRPQFRGQTMLPGLAAGGTHDPRLGGVADLRFVRPVVGVSEAHRHARRQGLVDALVDRRTTDPDPQSQGAWVSRAGPRPG